jgi:hypothetical protein
VTDKLTQYNLALGHLRERRLASLSENREPRRTLDSYWNQVTAETLEAGFWKFIKRSVMIDASTTIEPAFGYLYAFRIPDDWIRTVQIASDESFSNPLRQVKEETGYWYANITPLYASYNSNDPLYGMDLGSWPASFTKYHALELASQSCSRITGSEKLLEGPEGITRRLKLAKKDSLAKDAMNDPPGHAPAGTWTKSRRGFRTVSGSSDGGGSLF